MRRDNAHSGRPLALSVVACAVLLAISCSATSAEAATAVATRDGQITVLGDSNPHEFRVYDSHVDLISKRWFVQGTAIAAGWASFGPEINAAWSQVRAAYLQAHASLADAHVLQRPAEIVHEIFGSEAAIERDILEIVDRNLELQSRFTVVTDLMDELDLPGRALAVERLTGSAPADLETQFYGLEDEVFAIQDELKGLGNAVESLDARIRASSLSQSAKTLLLGYLNDLRTVYPSITGFIGKVFRFAGILGSVVVGAEFFTDAFSYYTDESIVIQDASGNEMVAALPCRQYVRSTSGQVLPDTVTCPAANPGSVFYPFGGGTMSLLIWSGPASDTIQLKLTKQNNPFAAVVVNGGAGDDTIEGAYTDDLLYGGAGNDTIYGRGGDDEIYGYSQLSEGTSEGNDRLYGGSGRDLVWGQSGDDLVMGGAGSDWAWWGVALRGGSGNDAVLGGSGRDEMAGDAGRDTIFAKESDFSARASTPTPKLFDEADYRIDCGSGPGEEYFTATPSDAGGAPLTSLFSCQAQPAFIPSYDTLNAGPSDDGRWPWFR